MRCPLYSEIDRGAVVVAGELSQKRLGHMGLVVRETLATLGSAPSAVDSKLRIVASTFADVSVISHRHVRYYNRSRLRSRPTAAARYSAAAVCGEAQEFVDDSPRSRWTERWKCSSMLARFIETGADAMKATRLLLICCFGFVFCAQGATPSTDPPASVSVDERAARDGVRVALEHYLKGHATGDAAHMRAAFLPTAHIEGNRDGKFVSWTVDEYCALFTGKPADDESKRVRTIDSIDVSGDAAMAKATLDHGSFIFTDYFVLLKVAGEWKIANKVYTRRTK